MGACITTLLTLFPVITVDIRGDGGAALSQRVRSDLRVRELLVSWAAYLERHDSNIAIDVQRIEWVCRVARLMSRLTCNGHALDADERLFAVPGCGQGHISLQAARKPLRDEPVLTSTPAWPMRDADADASPGVHQGHRHAAGRVHAADRKGARDGDG